MFVCFMKSWPKKEIIVLDNGRRNSSDPKGNDVRLLGWHAIFALEEFQEENRALSWIV